MRNVRKHIRVSPEKEHTVIVDINGENFIEVVHAADISEHGIGFIIPGRLEDCNIKDEVSVVITLPFPAKQIFQINARIIHISDTRFGVDFMDLKKDVRLGIRRYVEHILRKEPWSMRFRYKLELFYYTFRKIVLIPAVLVCILLAGVSLYLNYFSEGLQERTPAVAPVPQVSHVPLKQKPSPPLKTAEKDKHMVASAYSNTEKWTVGIVDITDRHGRIVSSTNSLIIKGGWFALPVEVCFGGSRWMINLNGEERATVRGGIWKSGDIIGLWKLENGDTFDGPQLYPWNKDTPVRWMSLDSGKTRDLEKVIPREKFNAFVMRNLPETVNGNGVFLQNTNVVGWTFKNRPDCGYMWSGPPGSELRDEITIDRFYTKTYAGGREELFGNAIAMDETVPAVERLEAFTEGFRAEPLLTSKNTPPFVCTKSALKHIKLLVKQLLEEELYREVSDILSDMDIMDEFDSSLLVSVILATARGYDVENAVELSESILEKIEPEKDKLVPLYLEWIKGFISQEDIHEGWNAYNTCVKTFPENSEIHLTGIELYLAEGDWAEAEKHLAQRNYPKYLDDRITIISGTISKLKGEEGKIVIRFKPGSGLIITDAILNGILQQEFIIDTGASMVTIPISTAGTLNISIDENTPVKRVMTTNGEVQAYEVILSSIEINDFIVYDVKALAFEMSENSRSLLGLNYIRRFHMELDDKNGTLYLKPR